MVRHERCILPGVACHVTQRGVDRRETFSDDTDRETYLSLLRANLADASASILGWCLMSNHVHLVVLPQRPDSLAILFRRVHGRYAQFYNVRDSRNGHLWQNRYFCCALGFAHVWTALRYVDLNPVRAGLLASASGYRWSSAEPHLGGIDRSGLLDRDWWERETGAVDWGGFLEQGNPEDDAMDLRQCTYAGRPFGDQQFTQALSERFGRHWQPGRPRKPVVTSAVPHSPVGL